MSLETTDVSVWESININSHLFPELPDNDVNEIILGTLYILTTANKYWA
jgi:hypothetical protein